MDFVAKDHPVPPPTVITYSKAYLPVLVMIISVPISLNFTHRSSFSSLTWMFLLKPDPECWLRLRPATTQEFKVILDRKLNNVKTNPIFWKGKVDRDGDVGKMLGGKLWMILCY